MSCFEDNTAACRQTTAGQHHAPLLCAGTLFAGYWLLSCAAPVPRCPEGAASQSPGCNWAGYLDGLLLGPDHLYPYPTCRRVRGLLLQLQS